MSVSLVVLRLEISEKHPPLKHIEYQDSKNNFSKREASPSEWPVLVSDTLLAIHRGQRVPETVTVITLDQGTIIDEMAALNEAKDDSDLAVRSEKVQDAQYIGGLPRLSSKESTPGPCSSKEGTPGVSDDGSTASRRGIRGYKDYLHFVSGNPMVDVTKGLLHLFKENAKTSLDEGECRSEMLCMLAVPTSITTHDLIHFTAPCNPAIQHIRIIRDSNPNQYMVLLKFRTQTDSDFFYNSFNGQKFNSIEPDICRLVYVARVETTSETDQGGLPIPGHTELPTCPVCLERMDESVDGVLTILCNHSFHGDCLAKWGDTSCPVCRFCQTPEEVPSQRCLSCGSNESLWICLICGHVGCGRYVEGHAHRHFMETHHLFSLQVGNNRVWDYVRDNYVHRLLQSEGDGKVVSYERVSSSPDTKEPFLEEDEKLSSLQLEFTHLLSSQMESQRKYFEDRIVNAQAEALREAEESKEVAAKVTKESEDLRKNLNSLSKEKQHLERKLQQMSTKLSKVTKDLETEQQMNICLREGRQEWAAKVDALSKSMKDKDEKITDLEGQVRDIMTHLDAMSTIQSNPELQGGQVAISQAKSKKNRWKKEVKEVGHF